MAIAHYNYKGMVYCTGKKYEPLSRLFAAFSEEWVTCKRCLVKMKKASEIQVFINK